MLDLTKSRCFSRSVSDPSAVYSNLLWWEMNRSKLLWRLAKAKWRRKFFAACLRANIATHWRGALNKDTDINPAAKRLQVSAGKNWMKRLKYDNREGFFSHQTNSASSRRIPITSFTRARGGFVYNDTNKRLFRRLRTMKAADTWNYKQCKITLILSDKGEYNTDTYTVSKHD